MKYLLKLNTNWADEMDIDGAYMLTEEKYNKFLEAVTSFEEDTCFYMCIGTNEEIDCQWCDIANDFEIMEITDSQAKMLEQLGMTNMGWAGSFYDSCVDDLE